MSNRTEISSSLLFHFCYVYIYQGPFHSLNHAFSKWSIKDMDLFVRILFLASSVLLSLLNSFGKKNVWITFTIIFFTVYYSFIFISFDKLTLSQTTIESKQTKIEKYNTTNLRIIQCVKTLEKKLKNSRIHPKLIQPR